jgi:hypothetical protein
MRLFSPPVFQIGVRTICCLALVASAVSIAADEFFLSKPPGEWTEAEALQVLNDSPWAHTITATTQDSQCDYEHPAFEGLFDEEFAQRIDAISPTPPAAAVKPDGAEYLIRLVSVKPMQAAAERLISLDEKWSHYRGGWVLDPANQPTNLGEQWYNPADEITITLALKHPGPEGQSFRDYAFRDSKFYPAVGVVHLWPCAAIKTTNGQVYAVVGGPGGSKEHTPPAIPLSFPGTFKGKPLISHHNEKLQVRIILNQRVFETTFTVNRTDLFDGTEKIMHMLFAVDEPTPPVSQ